ncbi:MAG: 5-(carboxyamino)imidazole ribonucleotide mutase [Candidatus Spechtbacteria bacterium RIFCSPLOWO2_01_FULL_43_12]|uniref:N5-carboxyaminoimidazole ribonucleotide mutase n=1 Tax=Candidatus Spechtbacteria bacterium RIFCSPLOWO2_01_FULL_43_12 TaxID=1802162 RepID=A0A1G2HG98_9BACT|nr:MAG: 5-(carboxyamino)imidazole ribonucleotide mutase [Candidatus Spechtbacteria bacterium RIFCSPLOWO2_01_FULL_43_12]
MNKLVGILMGSDSDLKVMSDAAKILDELEITYEISVLSTHRVPNQTADYAKRAMGRGIKVLIAGAGGAAALPGSLAALTTLPVIGVPVETKSLEGLDSLLSIVQMPPGVPVATVGIDSAKNAGILAAEIIGVSDQKISKRLDAYKQKLRDEVLSKNSKLQKLGWANYLKEKNAK